MVRKILLVIVIPAAVFSCNSIRQPVWAQAVALCSVAGGTQTRPVGSSVRFEFAEPNDTTRYVLSAISEKDFAFTATTYTDKILRDTNAFKVVNGEIRLPLSTGQFFTVRNNLSKGDSYLSYRYVGQLSAIGKYVMECTGHEWYEYFLVDKKTGDTAIFFEQPKISPKNTRLACVYYDMYQTERQTIQITLHTLRHNQISGSRTTCIKIGDEQYPLECLLVWENEKSLMVRLAFNESAPQYLRLRMR